MNHPVQFGQRNDKNNWLCKGILKDTVGQLHNLIYSHNFVRVFLVTPSSVHKHTNKHLTVYNCTEHTHPCGYWPSSHRDTNESNIYFAPPVVFGCAQRMKKDTDGKRYDVTETRDNFLL